MGVFDSFSAGLLGEPAWQAQKGYSSFLTIEFGPARQVVGFNDQTRLAGQWGLWIYCCDWQLTHRGQPLAWSEDEDAIIQTAVDQLNGQKLLAVRTLLDTGHSAFCFEDDRS